MTSENELLITLFINLNMKNMYF